MTETRSFHLGDLLSITDDRLLSPDLIDGVYNILNWMTGDQLMTHQLPLAADAMKPDLLQQHPWLAEITVPDLHGEAEVVTWLATAVAEHGEQHEVAPAPLAWGSHDPIRDFRNQYSDKPIIGVRVDGDQP